MALQDCPIRFVVLTIVGNVMPFLFHVIPERALSVGQTPLAVSIVFFLFLFQITPRASVTAPIVVNLSGVNGNGTLAKPVSSVCNCY